MKSQKNCYDDCVEDQVDWLGDGVRIRAPSLAIGALTIVAAMAVACLALSIADVPRRALRVYGRVVEGADSACTTMATVSSAFVATLYASEQARQRVAVGQRIVLKHRALASLDRGTFDATVVAIASTQSNDPGVAVMGGGAHFELTVCGENQNVNSADNEPMLGPGIGVQTDLYAPTSYGLSSVLSAYLDPGRW